MASKATYIVVAVVGIAAASGAAWWLQNRQAPSTQTVIAEGAAPQRGASSPQAGASAPRPAVEVARVRQTRITDDTQAVGNLRSRQSVVLRPEVSGRITQLNFRDGERVRRGQLLVQFDDQLPLAQVQQSQAEMSIAQANHKRNQELVGQGFISQRSVDESSANLQVAQAKLSLAQATAARLRIVAPFDGIAGIRLVNVGDYLKDGADIVNLEDLEAMYVDYRLPERFQTKVGRGQRATLELDALPGQRFVAVVQAIDPLIDANGRSIAIRGCIDNRSLVLRPGMFARVNTVFGEREDALVIPEEAIVPQGGRQYVYRLSEGGEVRTAQRVEVKVGVRQPGRVEIVSGLALGDTVVTAGQQRIQRDGMQVRVVDPGRGPAGGGGAGQPRAGASGPRAPQDGPAPAGAGASAPQEPAAASQPATPPQRMAQMPAPRLDGPNPCQIQRTAAAEEPRRAPVRR